MLSISLYQTLEKHTTLSGNVVHQFCHDKSVDFIYFLCDSFKLFLLKPGREKQKSLNFFQKPSKTRPCAKEKFDKWWREIMLL